MATITLTIPNDKIEELKLGYLKQNPVPVDEFGDPLMTELEWVKECIINNIKSDYRRGKKRLANEAAFSIEDNLIS